MLIPLQLNLPHHRQSHIFNLCSDGCALLRDSWWGGKHSLVGHLNAVRGWSAVCVLKCSVCCWTVFLFFLVLVLVLPHLLQNVSHLPAGGGVTRHCLYKF